MKFASALFTIWFLHLSFACCQGKEEMQPALSGKLERYLAEISDSGNAFSALVAVNGSVIFQKGFGWIDSQKTKPASEKTIFNIASITKSFTAEAIFILKEKNLLSMDDSLQKFFRDIPADKRSITIDQLMTHSSGLGQNYLSDGIKDRDSAVRSILQDSLRFKPGTGFAYSNENYEILGAVVEIISHQTYEEFVRENILMKAGMNYTWFWGEAASIDKNLIAGKNRILDRSSTIRNWGYIGSGGIYTNCGDLYNWFEALKNGDIITRNNLEIMWTPQLNLGDNLKISFGWFISETSRGKEIWIRGTEDWGHNAVLRWFPEKKTVVIVLGNSGELGGKNSTANRFISDGILEILFQ